MKQLKIWWKKYNKYLDPAFLISEAAMHLYLTIYLFFNWTNLAIWLFTVYELSMFSRLLFKKWKGKK